MIKPQTTLKKWEDWGSGKKNLKGHEKEVSRDEIKQSFKCPKGPKPRLLVRGPGLRGGGSGKRGRLGATRGKGTEAGGEAGDSHLSISRGEGGEGNSEKKLLLEERTRSCGGGTLPGAGLVHEGKI